MIDRNTIHNPGNSSSLLGYDPAGSPVHKLAQMPKYLEFDEVHVGDEFITIDGYIFPYSCMCKKFSIWIQRSIRRWMKEHPDDWLWMTGILEAWEERWTGDF